MVRLPLLEACKGVLADIVKKYQALYLGVDFAKKYQTAQLSSPTTGERRRGILKQNRYCDFGTTVWFFAAFSDRSLGFVENFSLTPMNVFYQEMMKKVLFDQRSGKWMRRELVRLLSEIRKFRSVVEKRICAALLFWSTEAKIHLLKTPVDDLQRFRNLCFIEEKP